MNFRPTLSALGFLAVLAASAALQPAAAQTTPPPQPAGSATQLVNPTPRDCCECVEIADSQGTPADADKKIFINLPGKAPIRIEGENGLFKFNLDVRVRNTPVPGKPGLDCSAVYLSAIRIIPDQTNGPAQQQTIELAGQNLRVYTSEITLADMTTRGKWTIEVQCAPNASTTDPNPAPPSTAIPLLCRFPITLDSPCSSCTSGTCVPDASNGCFTYTMPLGTANGGDTTGSLQFFTPDFSFPGLAGLHAYVPPSYPVSRTATAFTITTPTTVIAAVPTPSAPPPPSPSHTH